jgi:hypothetical protein
VRQVRLDPNWEVPTLEVVLGNIGKVTTVRASLVFDTGAGLTQVDVGMVERLGYSANDAVEIKKGDRSPPSAYLSVRSAELTSKPQWLKAILNVFSITGVLTVYR